MLRKRAPTYFSYVETNGICIYPKQTYLRWKRSSQMSLKNNGTTCIGSGNAISESSFLINSVSEKYYYDVFITGDVNVGISSSIDNPEISHKLTVLEGDRIHFDLSDKLVISLISDGKLTNKVSYDLSSYYGSIMHAWCGGDTSLKIMKDIQSCLTIEDGKLSVTNFDTDHKCIGGNLRTFDDAVGNSFDVTQEMYLITVSSNITHTINLPPITKVQELIIVRNYEKQSGETLTSPVLNVVGNIEGDSYIGIPPGFKLCLVSNPTTNRWEITL